MSEKVEHVNYLELTQEELQMVIDLKLEYNYNYGYLRLYNYSIYKHAGGFFVDEVILKHELGKDYKYFKSLRVQSIDGVVIYTKPFEVFAEEEVRYITKYTNWIEGE